TRSPAACSSTWPSRSVETTRSTRSGGLPSPSLLAPPTKATARPSAAAAASTWPASETDPGRATRSTGTPSTAVPGGAGQTSPPSSRSWAPTAQNTSARPACSAGWTRRGPGRSPHTRGGGHPLPGLLRPSGSKAQRASCMASRSAALNCLGRYCFLSKPTPCSPVIEPPCSRQVHRIPAARPCPRPARRVVQAQGVQVSGAGVEPGGHPQPALVGQLGDPAQHLGQGGPGDDPVLDVVVGADPADGGKGGLASLPEPGPLVVCRGVWDGGGAGLAAEPLGLVELVLALGLGAVQLHDQDRPGLL